MKVLTLKNIVLAALILLRSPYLQAQTFAERPEAQQFINQMVAKHGFQQQALMRLFKKFESSAEILQKISRPYEDVTWQQYRKLFITQQRIQAGLNFWHKYAPVLQKAEQEFGVPAEIIVAILGVETFYGKNTGKYPVFQALATLAFDYHKRSTFFRNELEQYLLLTKEQHLPADQLLGSYAGAMGTPQFIASSYRNFAVDFAAIGKIDLIHNIPNAIGSVANYFKMHGWQYQQPIIHKAHLHGQKYKALHLADPKNPQPNLAVATLKRYNIFPAKQQLLPLTAKVALIQLEGKYSPHEYWLGRENFYVITRYNHSVNYAMAVYELSECLRKRFKP